MTEQTQREGQRPPESCEGIVIEDRLENKRDCGYRNPGGKYIIAGGMAAVCGRLPIPLTYCPTCGAGIKFCRSWSWIDGDAIAKTKPCSFESSGDPTKATAHCLCPLGQPKIGRVGLLWIGEKFYKTPADFTGEAMRMGVSRRVPAIPKGFKVGETLVLVAHKKAIAQPCPDCVIDGVAQAHDCPRCKNERIIYQPAIFHAFVPSAIEYVVSDDDTEEKLAKLVKDGFTLVRVHKIREQLEIEIEEGAANG